MLLKWPKNKKKLWKTIAKLPKFDIEWYIIGNKHVVRYGKQVKEFSKKEDIKASEEFGYCVRHAAECDGLLD